MEQKIEWTGALEKYLPAAIYGALTAIRKDIAASIEEIRLRSQQPLMVYTCQRGYCVGESGRLSETEGLTVSEDDTDQVFHAITGRSPYAYEDEIRQGFLTLESGIRAGLAGSALLKNGGVRTFKSVSGINFRIPRQVTGVARRLLPLISDGTNLFSTLIISAPRLGKTTLARDIARCAGSGIGLAPARVAVIDERQELAASIYGSPLFDVGRETDVISGIYKHTGVFMALRSLSPDVIVTDEIGKADDLDALKEVINGGVVMIATAHAPDFDSLVKRLFFKQLCDERLFDSYVVLSGELGRITVAQIHDSAGRHCLAAPMLLKGEVS